MSIPGELKVILKFQTKLVRRVWRRYKKQNALHRAGSPGLESSPVFFTNSFPKSGTHLLTQVLEGFPLVGPAVDSGLPAVVMFEGASGRERTTREILRDLRNLSHGDIGYGHLHARPEIVDLFTAEDFCAYFILRDPRDVVVSHVHYVTDIEPNHVHHQYYTQTLKTFDERLRTSILGRPDAANPFPDIAGRFAPFLGWMSQPSVLALKYEDFNTDRAAAVGTVLQHAVKRGFQLTTSQEQAVELLMAQMDPQRSPTFRQGKSGGWRAKFTDEHKSLFKQVAGSLLITLGYEQDENW
jgi:hypothetical protein